MLSTITSALADLRHETARRLCLAALDAGTDDRNAVLFALHQAYRSLGDFGAATMALDEIGATTDDERFEKQLLLAEDYHILTGEGFYRESAERERGYTIDEYIERYTGYSDGAYSAATELATTDERRRRLATSLTVHKRADLAATLDVEPATEPANATPAPKTLGGVDGAVRFADGSPAGGLELVIGYHTDAEVAIPDDYMRFYMHYDLTIPNLQTQTTTTDASGRYRFGDVPIGKGEFIAVKLDPAINEIATRFLALDFAVSADTALDLTVGEWASAPATPASQEFADRLSLGGTEYRLVAEQRMRNPFCFTFPRQAVHLTLPERVPNGLIVLDSADPAQPLEWQATGDREVLVFSHLDPLSDRKLGLYAPLVASEPGLVSAELAPVPDADGKTAVISTGRASFRIAWGNGDGPPLVAVRGEDDIWRGQGRFVLPPGVAVASRETAVEAVGPLEVVVAIRYALSNGQRYDWRLTAHAGEAYLLVKETSPVIDGAAFEFSLREFIGGRGFLHWTPEHGNRHWSTLDGHDCELARLQESVAWWIPPQGFGYAMTADGLDRNDYIGVFTSRRGEWDDREFARLCNGPIEEDGTENWELDWPFPEMVGSTISMITAHTNRDGDAYFRFGFFDGQRQWGILVSTLERNDGTYKEISHVQHKTSSPRLEAFMNWRLDEQDQIVRPSIVARREELIAIREKRTSPTFAPFWKRIVSGKAFGPAEGVRFVVEGDPAVAWRKKRELVAQAKVRSRMTLLGRDYSDMYSPVGARPITQYAEDYDLIAASGIFTVDEERLVRAFLMLMGHLYMETDFMNWQYNSRNANFESDRVDVVGAIGLCFRGNPDTDVFIKHCTDLMERSLNVYCTPGSGKWYENPACYYLHASKCRTNLAYHLFAHGIFDSAALPRFKDYLRWGTLLLTPKTPHSYDRMRDGLSADKYHAPDNVRRMPPVGDHALIGPWVPDYYGLMSLLYRKRDSEFADTLLWAFNEGGRNGGYYGNAPLLFCVMTEEQLNPPQGVHPTPLASRRLEGFGAIMRGNVGADDEFYLLFKQGPGGYRYHRTEGSIIVFADGKPLIYDGGEAGETWRHSTLSFHDTHMPLAPGHVERFASTPSLDFAQGVHPVALAPGQPVFLSDDCHHSLVKVAYDRFREPNPAVVRSIVWVKDEYIVMHDELNLPPYVPSHWHLQVVADSETGNVADGYRFAGRFGTDLQVLLPDQQFESELVETVPILDYHRTPANSFAMRHLCLTGANPSRYVAVLRPLHGGRKPLAASLLPGDGTALRVVGDGIDDTLYFAHKGASWNANGAPFAGRYAAILRRPSGVERVVVDGEG